jgi:hypothetical protein
MDWFERRIVQYVLMWAPYGLLPEDDVFPTFGMTGPELMARFAGIVSAATPPDRDLDDSDRALLDRAALPRDVTAKLWSSRPVSSERRQS